LNLECIYGVSVQNSLKIGIIMS